jgi:serine/threonine protein phosphatase PrpC
MIVLVKNELIKQNNIAFEISYITEQGGRPVNEDTVLIEYTDKNILLAIADGLGAHGGGDIASKVAVDVAKKEYMQISKPNSKKIYKIFGAINKAIISKQTDEIKMKTTLACVLCRGKWIYMAHIGDTRIYVFNNDGEFYLTADHSIAYEEVVVQNHGTLDSIRGNPNRHILSAALGVKKIRPPDIFKQEIKSGLSVLICSDGFWEYVNEDEMKKTLKNTTTAHEWLEEMLKYHSGKTDIFNDNYSAICLKIIK